jgi:hypothetical protein
LDKIYKQYDTKGHAYNMRVFSQRRQDSWNCCNHATITDLLEGMKIHR